MVQEYRRYARALPFMIGAHEEPGTPLDAPAHQFLNGAEPCFRSLWRDLTSAPIEGALAFIIDPSSSPIEILAVMMARQSVLKWTPC